MKIILRWALAALLAVALGPIAEAQNIFNKFEPATGVLKGSSSTYVTTAAVAADIKGLWTGTCDATTFLRGDGACAAASNPPGGSNTQVQFNNSGAFGGSSNFFWDNTNNFLHLNGAGGGVLETATAQPLNLLAGDVLVDTTQASVTLTSSGASGAGGTVTVTAGNAATSGSGGAVALNAGNGAASLDSGGSISLSGGTPGAGGAAGNIAFYTNGNVTARALINGSDGGITVGSPTGGDKGTGTINATGLYVNGTALSAGGTPGGSNTQVQYNSSGAFAGDSGMTYTSGIHKLTVTGIVQGGGISSQSTGSSFGLVASSTLTNTAQGLQLFSSATNQGADVQYQVGGTGSTFDMCQSGTAGQCLSGDALDDFVLSNVSGHAIRFNSSASPTASNSDLTIGAANAGITSNNPTGGAQGAGTINVSGGYYVNGVVVGSPTSTTASWTISSGCTTTPSLTIQFNKIGSMVFARIPWTSCTATGSPTSITLSGSYPSGYAPSAGGNGGVTESVTMGNNGANAAGFVNIISSGSITYRQTVLGAFTGTFSTGLNSNIYDTQLTWQTN